MPTNIEAELDKNAAIFQFLCTIPTIDLTSPLEEECFICKEKYQNNGWELGGTVHHPVALPCGHILGFVRHLSEFLPSSSLPPQPNFCIR